MGEWVSKGIPCRRPAGMYTFLHPHTSAMICLDRIEDVGAGGPRRAPKVYEYAALRSLMATQLPRTLWARCAPKSASVPVRGCDPDCSPRLECLPPQPIAAPSSKGRWMLELKIVYPPKCISVYMTLLTCGPHSSARPPTEVLAAPPTEVCVPVPLHARAPVRLRRTQRHPEGLRYPSD